MRTPSVFLLLCLVVMPADAVHAQDAPATKPNTEFSLPAGITLPRAGTVFVLDTTDKGPALIKLVAKEIVTNLHAASNLARSQVFLNVHSTVELEGINAAVTLHSPAPSIFVRLSGDDPDLFKNRIRLIRLTQTKNRRIVSTYSQNVFGGQRNKKFDEVAIAKNEYEPDVWLRVTPAVPLIPGEYGIVIMPKDSNLVPDSVYDFDFGPADGK